MTVVAGVDIGNATTEVVAVADGRLLGAARLPTRGRKGSDDSLRGAAALVRRLERRIGVQVDEARVAPLRAVDTMTVTVPAVAPPTGRLRLLAAGVATPGGTGACVGVPMWLDAPAPAAVPGAAVHGAAVSGAAVSGAAAPDPEVPPAVVALVPARFGYARAAARLRDLLASGVPVGAVLVAGDEGVLVANRLASSLPIIDQVDTAAAGACGLLAVEVRPPGQPLTLLTDPIALSAALSLPPAEAGDAATLSRALLDHSNAVIGRAGGAEGAEGTECAKGAGGGGRSGSATWRGLARGPDEPWLGVRGHHPAERIPLRTACAHVADWPVGSVCALAIPSGQAEVDDVFAVDLTAVAQIATARQGSLGRSVLVASLQRRDAATDHAAALSGLLNRPVRCVLSEPAAARIGAATTPGARHDAVVVDLGAGTIDVIAPDGEIVAAGAGELLTNAVAETLGIPRAAADWVKRGPSVRVEGGQRFEAEDGSRGFLDRPAPAAAAGMLAVTGPAGLMPFDRRHSPAEWRAIRLRLKQAVFSANLRRALRTLGTDITDGPGPRQVLVAGGPAGDDELLGVLLRSLPPGVAAGRAYVGGTLAGSPAGHRYAVALGLALPSDPVQ